MGWRCGNSHDKNTIDPGLEEDSPGDDWGVSDNKSGGRCKE